MTLASSPRKTIPLNGGSESIGSSRSESSISNVVYQTTKRAFFCSVVAEGGHYSSDVLRDVQDLLASFGRQVSAGETKPSLSRSASASDLLDNPSTRPNPSTVADVLNELLTTERSYVQRLNILKKSYADPLRSFAKTKDTAILAPYEAKTLFGNIDALLPTNEAFLEDLERMLGPNGHRLVGGIGDVALKHFRDLRAFDCYKIYYSKREEAQSIFEREMLKKSSTGFAGFIDRIKYGTDAENRIGLRELLMDPVQRIPRYTLLFRTMVKHMSPSDPQRAKLIEADEVASNIALCETDEQTKRATVMYSLERSIEGFPPGLISNARRFIDCIDVDDVPTDLAPFVSASAASSISSSATASSSMSNAPLHCTLFLFDDCLMIVKRASSSTSGRILAGLNDIDRGRGGVGAILGLASSVNGSSAKKSAMSCKSVIDITDVVVADIGGKDFHMYLEQTPTDQVDRWSNRPLRSYTVVNAPTPSHAQQSNDKQRFLENLWKAQALYRAKGDRSLALCANETEVGSGRGARTIARTYFNVYQRTAYLGEPKKGKVVLHVDPSGVADPIPFGIEGGPFVIIRVQPMDGDVSRYIVTSSDPTDEGEEDIVHTATIPSRVVQTIHQFGLFKFRSTSSSRPGTPSSVRSRSTIFTLDSISRNLFNARAGNSAKSVDVFGSVSTTGTHKRSRSGVSRASSIRTQTTGTTDASARFSHRSNSTAATSIMDLDGSPRSKSPSPKKESPMRKLIKRGRSPSPGASLVSREPSVERGVEYTKPAASGLDESEMDLSRRLELARTNSLSQQGHERPTRVLRERSVPTETIPEDDLASSGGHSRQLPEVPLRPISPASTIRRPGSTTPTRASTDSPRKPFGPRSPLRSPDSVIDIEQALENTLSQLGPSNRTVQPVTPPSSSSVARTNSAPSTRKRQPLENLGHSVGNAETPTRPADLREAPGSVEPLSIRKKTSVRHKISPNQVKKSRESPSTGAASRRDSDRRRNQKSTDDGGHKGENKGENDLITKVVISAESTRQDIHSSRRAVKRIKLELESYKSRPVKDSTNGPRGQSPGFTSFSRSPAPRYQPTKPMDLTSHADPVEEWVSSMEDVVYEAERDLKKTASAQESLLEDLKLLAAESREKPSEIEKLRNELQRSKRQCELVKKLLADATAENEIMYEAFNEELDGMFNDANLPETDAWVAMTADLRQAKDSRNAFAKENSKLKRSLEEAELQKEEWSKLLRSHGLIS